MRKRLTGASPARRGRTFAVAVAGLGMWIGPAELAVSAAAQDPPAVARPIPGPVVPPSFYRRALDAGTRSVDGQPGAAYWQQHASYDIEARLDPGTATVEGRVLIRYENRSPVAIPVLVLHLHQNLHAPGSVRNEAQEITGGVELRSVTVDGTEARTASAGGAPPMYRVQGTLMPIFLGAPLQPGATAEVEVVWRNVLPQNGAGRMGYSDRSMYFVAYWFPKIAVFDDLRGWDAEPYLGAAEFYDAFADYEVSLTVPVGWTVMGTGDLLNAAEVLSPQTIDRLAEAAVADDIVHVATREDRAAGTVTARPATGQLTYRFSASDVRDFAWTASDVQLWDGTSSRVPDRDGDGVEDRVAIHTFWRETRAPKWAQQALYAKHAIEFESTYTGLAYPWPHMTSVEGADIIGGGMEFPMLTLIGPYDGAGQSPADLYNVTAHELAHMWIPMIVGANEKRHAWMDEGSTTFLENMARLDYFESDTPHENERANYLQVALAELEQPLMRHGDYYEPGPGYGTASYAKPSTLLWTLHGLLGEEVFERAYRTFVAEWAFRHPTPWDFFATFERVAGRDLDWFWRSFYFETWTLDHAVASVEAGPDGTVITIEDRGWAVMPVRLQITTTEGGTMQREIPVDEWLRGRTRVEIVVPASAGAVTRVAIDPDVAFPDVARDNDVWPSGG